MELKIKEMQLLIDYIGKQPKVRVSQEISDIKNKMINVCLTKTK